MEEEDEEMRSELMIYHNAIWRASDDMRFSSSSDDMLNDSDSPMQVDINVHDYFIE